MIGVGRMGALHVNALERTRRTKLVAVADPNEWAARSRIGSRPIAWYDDYRALLERPDVSAVCVCTPSSRHAKVALHAIAAGKHVLVEKPMATSLGDAVRMAEAARAARVKLMVGHIERFNPAVVKLAELIAAGHIGRVFRVLATRMGPMPIRLLDTGVTMDLATHDLDIMQFVLRQPISSVYAEGRRLQHPSAEDLVTCMLRFEDDGPIGLLDVNWLTPQKRRELTVLGERGMLSTSYLTQDLWFTKHAAAPTPWPELARVRGDSDGAAVRLAVRKREPLRAELEAFVRCVLDDSVEPVTAIDGCRAVAAALAILESAETSQRAMVREPPRLAPAVPLDHDPAIAQRLGA